MSCSESRRGPSAFIDDGSRRIITEQTGSPSVLWVAADVVRVSVGSGSRETTRFVNAILRRIGFPYRINAFLQVVTTSGAQFPYQHGIRLDRDPGLTLARLAAEALGLGAS